MDKIVKIDGCNIPEVWPDKIAKISENCWSKLPKPQLPKILSAEYFVCQNLHLPKMLSFKVTNCLPNYRTV